MSVRVAILFSRRARADLYLGKKMNNENKDVSIGERLASAEAAREKRVLDQILKDIADLEAQDRPQVETKPRLVLVR